MTPERWTLVFDESGRFDDWSQPVCIAGLLVRSVDDPAVEAEHRAVLRAATPTIPYPPHMMLVNVGAAHYAWWRTAPFMDAAAHPDASFLRRAHGEIVYARGKSPPHPEAWSALQALDQGRQLDYEESLELDAWIHRSARGAAIKLETVASHVRDRLRDTLHGVRQTLRGADCFAVTAADHGVPLEPQGPFADRYLRLLTTVLERVLAVFRARPPVAVEISVECLLRHVAPTRRFRRPLSRADVARCIAHAERFALDPPPAGQPDPHVRLIPLPPTEYDERSSSGAVFADFLSNRLRHPLKLSGSWADLTERVRRGCAVPIEAQARVAPDAAQLPTGAAVGTARAAIDAVFAGVDRAQQLSRDELLALEPGWTGDQALRWIELTAVLR